jgi:hypothetical protein
MGFTWNALSGEGPAAATNCIMDQLSRALLSLCHEGQHDASRHPASRESHVRVAYTDRPTGALERAPRASGAGGLTVSVPTSCEHEWDAHLARIAGLSDRQC